MNNCPRPRTRPATALAPASHEDGTMNETTGGRRWCRARPRRAGVLAVTAGLVLLTAACGGSPSSSGRPSSTGTGSSPNAGGSASSRSALAFSRCVRSHGVPNFPDPPAFFNGKFPGSSPQQLGVSVSRIRAATEACLNLLPPVPGQASLTAQQQQDYLRAAACMRSHGISGFPDPDFSNGTVNLTIPSSIDASSPQFTQARQICQRLIPPGLPYSGSRSGG
jgi:hypothetical protein